VAARRDIESGQGDPFDPALLATAFVFAMHFFATTCVPKSSHGHGDSDGMVSDEEMHHERPELLDRSAAKANWMRSGPRFLEAPFVESVPRRCVALSIAWPAAGILIGVFGG